MKKRSIIVIALVLAFLLTFTLFACKDKDLNDQSTQLKEGANIESIAGGAINELNLSLEVAEGTTNIDLATILTVSEGASWKLYSDAEGQTEVVEIANLADGVNVYYIKITSEDANHSATYTLNIFKNHKVKITYYITEGNEHSSEMVLTGTTLETGPAAPAREGYTFKGWGTEGHKVTGPTSFIAKWGIKKYMLALNKNNEAAGDVEGGGSKDYDSNVTVKAFTNPGYTFLGWYEGETQIYTNAENTLKMPASNKTLEARWAAYQRLNEADIPTADGEYVLFGEFPQEIKKTEVTVATTQDARGYYLGSDGAYYAKVMSNPHNKYSQYTFSDGSSVDDAEEYYFKVMPLKWRILNYNTLGADGNEALILCENIIANMKFAETSNNYKESGVRAWLIGEFYDKAFSTFQKESIKITSVDNSEASTAYQPNPKACDNTTDNVFLLSYQDIRNTAYGFDSISGSIDAARAKITSDYTRATGAYVSINDETFGNGYWLLRSPNKTYDGNANRIDYRGAESDNYVMATYFGVAPTLTLKLG